MLTNENRLVYTLFQQPKTHPLLEINAFITRNKGVHQCKHIIPCPGKRSICPFQEQHIRRPACFWFDWHALRSLGTGSNHCKVPDHICGVRGERTQLLDEWVHPSIAVGVAMMSLLGLPPSWSTAALWCAIVGCSNCADRDKDRWFFRLPSIRVTRPTN